MVCSKTSAKKIPTEQNQLKLAEILFVSQKNFCETA